MVLLFILWNMLSLSPLRHGTSTQLNSIYWYMAAVKLDLPNLQSTWPHLNSDVGLEEGEY